ncbi:hypothetical protein Hanom_Chr05g00468721 [Helianthus anomalus]
MMLFFLTFYTTLPKPSKLLFSSMLLLYHRSHRPPRSHRPCCSTIAPTASALSPSRLLLEIIAN